MRYPKVVLFLIFLILSHNRIQARNPVIANVVQEITQDAAAIAEKGADIVSHVAAAPYVAASNVMDTSSQFVNALRLPLANMPTLAFYSQRIGFLLAEIEALIKILGPDGAINVLKYINRIIKPVGGLDSQLGMNILRGLLHLLGGRVIGVDPGPWKDDGPLDYNKPGISGNGLFGNNILSPLFGRSPLLSFLGGNDLGSELLNIIENNGGYLGEGLFGRGLLGKMLLGLAAQTGNSPLNTGYVGNNPLIASNIGIGQENGFPYYSGIYGNGFLGDTNGVYAHPNYVV